MNFFNVGLGGAGSGRDNSGYDPSMIIDKSILESLKELGYSLSPVSYDPEYVFRSFTKISIQVGERSVNGFQDGNGNLYVILEGGTVYLIEKSSVNPTSGIPDPDDGRNGGSGGGSGGGGGGTIDPDDGRNGGSGGGSGGGGGGNNGGNRITPPGGTIGSGRIFTKFDAGDVVPNQQEIVTRGLWTNNSGMLTDFYTSSEQTAGQKEYSYEVWNGTGSLDCSVEAQFSVAYGNILGSGSEDVGGQIEDTPSRAIYGQYQLLCLDSDETSFTMDGSTAGSIYIVNVNRARMLEYIDEGNIEINLAHLSGSEYVAGGGDPDTYTGSNVGLKGDGSVVRLIDDSTINQPTIKQSGEVYNMVSGSIEDGVYNSSDPVIYGKLYKRLGYVVLNGDMLDASASFGTVTGREIDGDNSFKLFTAISGAADYNDGSGDTLGFSGRGAEVVKSSHYFCRVKNAEYNFSNNPTFVSGTLGNLRHPGMKNNPTVYITQIGLYNESKELMAIAKLSQPIKKSFTTETLLKVKLDY